MRIRVDADELDGAIEWLDGVDDRVMDEAEKVVVKGTINIKRGAQNRISGYAHLPHYPHAITDDVDRIGNKVESEIGPDRDRMQGGLGSYIEFGTVNNPPMPHLNPELDAEAPRFVAAAARLGQRLLS